MEADLSRRRLNSFVIISPGILKRLVGHLRGDQIFSEDFKRLPNPFIEHPGDDPNYY